MTFASFVGFMGLGAAVVAAICTQRLCDRRMPGHVVLRWLLPVLAFWVAGMLTAGAIGGLGGLIRVLIR